MKKIKTTIGIAALVVSTTAWGPCTQAQVDFFLQKQAEVATTPDVADDIALRDAYDTLMLLPDTSCNEWYWWAIEAGWTHEQWIYPLSGIMFDESGCNPEAHNPSGATGLTQVMPMWIDDCGGGNLRDPMFNLVCAKHVYDVSSWEAWSTYPP